MDRRKFVKSTAAAVGLSALSPGSMAQNSSEENRTLLQKLVAANDELIIRLRPRIITDKNDRWFGGLRDQWDIPTAGGTSRWIEILACAYVSEQSGYFHSRQLEEWLEQSAGYMLEAQHEDGTIDLVSTNFHSPPDTGFVMDHICPSYYILKQSGRRELDLVLEKLEQFILRAADALTVGGIHTPNHRWVVSRALAWANKLFPHPKYVSRIDEWLGEGIDIDPDGQFTERSTTVYTPLTDRCFIALTQLLDRPHLLEPVRKNLEMTLYYVHPDGEVVTAASRRQDQYRKGSMAPYYIPYRTMAQHDNNGRFAAMARWIESTAGNKLATWLIHFLVNPALSDKMPPDSALPNDYVKVFSHSKLARIRHGELSATILADNPFFFNFHKGAAAIEAIRFAAAFFGKGQFSGPELAVEGNTFTLEQKLAGPYYQPYPKDQLPGDGDWDKMPRMNRPQSEVQHYRASVTVTDHDKYFEIEFRAEGTDNVPVAIEIGLRKGGELVGAHPTEHTPNAWLFGGEELLYRSQGQTIRISPGQALHKWTQLRGALPKLDAESVYITGFTPFHHTIRIS